MMNYLKHPLTRNLDIDDPRTTLLRRQIIQQKPFLRKIYEDWYSWIFSTIPQGEGIVLELGSGAGFLDEYVPDLITTEVFYCPLVKIIMDACFMPFTDGLFKVIILVNVFHHIPNARIFLREASRCLRPGGKILMVEPWVSMWSYLVYRYLHHEPFNVRTPNWTFSASGPLSGSNHALPWIVFDRDIKLFKSEYTHLAIESINVEKPFVYLLSGGVSMKSLMPGYSYRFWSKFENLLGRWSRELGMFARIELTRL
jgi:SAM-dependent methyltransferase